MGTRNRDMLQTLVSGERQADRGTPCTLDYPARFFAAVMFVKTYKDIQDQDRLCLHALFQQVTEGENKTTRPWGPFVSVLSQVQWDAWKHLGQMKAPEAARLYVSTCDTFCPSWWQILSDGNDAAKVEWIRAEVKEMSDLFKERMDHERAEAMMHKMEEEVKRLTAANETQEVKKEIHKVLEEVQSVVELVSPEDQAMLTAAMKDVQEHIKPAEMELPMDTLYAARLEDEMGRLEDSLAKHVVSFEPTHERAASQQSLSSLCPVKLEPGRPDWLEAFSEPLREEIPGLVGDIPYNETKLPKTRQRGMSSVKKPEDVKGMLDNVMTVFQGGGARDPFEDAEGILTVTQPDGTVPLDMFTTLSLGAYTENIEEKIKEKTSKYLDACDSLHEGFLTKLAMELDKATAAAIEEQEAARTNEVKRIQQERANKELEDAERRKKRIELEDRMREQAEMAREEREMMDVRARLAAKEQKLKLEEDKRLLEERHAKEHAAEAHRLLMVQEQSDAILVREANQNIRSCTVLDPDAASTHLIDRTSMAKLARISTKDTWTMPLTGGEQPIARHEHAACVYGKKMVIIGGRRSGRLMDDVMGLDLETLKWSRMNNLEGDVMPPCAGHQIALVNNVIVVVGGLGKEESEDIALRLLDLEACLWVKPNMKGPAPTARAGFAMCKLARYLWIFGGEDKNRDVLDEIHCFDTESMEWQAFDPFSVSESVTAGPPSLAYHTACAYENRYILMFGGVDANGVCSGALYVLDFLLNRWIKPQVMGTPPFARAGHASAILGRRMYIVGGGDGCRAVEETLCLNLTKIDEGIIKWEPVTDSSVKSWLPDASGMHDSYVVEPTDFTAKRSPLSSEGLTCIPVPCRSGGSLLAFGGSDGNFYNDLLVLNPASADSENTIEQAKAAYVGVSTKDFHKMQNKEACKYKWNNFKLELQQF
mmetsp:Transcript_30423/g.58510  ORF Transcript_30423/g.58510 Transcript_30423/m.58510 type:complete len:935 (+) Transcript_30423:69-2873(+)|eukprot:CAMPEP_0114258664 /NCGR_PEP_ID=MMETSP0058-20121206/19453_1 /TAXON_ID=36894 /ORGANISM="Pyramimonas parkeae, CCMP726" /LENGTH=934 /DNA_ID=CAMNT_0001373605 /DNA_START=23 /DNA_END=2827 /DNA_ORIENTATION=+